MDQIELSNLHLDWKNDSKSNEKIYSEFSREGFSIPSRNGIGTTPLTNSWLNHRNALHYTINMRNERRRMWLTRSICDIFIMITSVLLLFLTVYTSVLQPTDKQICSMSFMRSSYYKFKDFRAQNNQLNNKYNLFLYREVGIDDSRWLTGIPVLFVPGNAGSYKQVRSIASEAAYYFQQVVKHNSSSSILNHGPFVPLDFFTLDFNEDLSAFDGTCVIHQAEYLNDAIRYILSLYTKRSNSNILLNTPFPSSVILLGHSMGGIVARTAITMANYEAKSVNTIITMATPHSHPPITFDSNLVRVYNYVNRYWKNSFTPSNVNSIQGVNRLNGISLISITGGPLDALVPSDYANIRTIIPDTHGFSVFTSSIPYVWTSMDHLAITWCDELRKKIVKSLYDILDVESSQSTKPLSHRMNIFRNNFLAGFHDQTKASLDPTIRTIDTSEISEQISPYSSTIQASTYTITFSLFRHPLQSRYHILDIPYVTRNDSSSISFSFISNSTMASLVNNLELLVCNFSSSITHQLSCHRLLKFSILPIPTTSTSSSSNAISTLHFIHLVLPVSSYSQLIIHEKVHQLESSPKLSPSWATAELRSTNDINLNWSLSLISTIRLFLSKVTFPLPSTPSIYRSIKLSFIDSYLFYLSLSLVPLPSTTVSHQHSSINFPVPTQCRPVFLPILRQYISSLHESKFYTNFSSAYISSHLNPPLFPIVGTSDSLNLQLWLDPSCPSHQLAQLSLKINFLKSFGQLWLRYRPIFLTFHLSISALTLHCQFSNYSKTNRFPSFSFALYSCLFSSLPLLTIIIVLTFSILLSSPTFISSDFFHNLLIGSFSPVTIFLVVPLFIYISAGLSILLNYLSSFFLYFFAYTSRLSSLLGFSLSPPLFQPFLHKYFSIPRLINITFILFSLSIVIPYQSIFLVICLRIFLATVSSVNKLHTHPSLHTLNRLNFTHSILIIFLSLLPINIPLFIVWFRNLSTSWISFYHPFYNVVSILPFILLSDLLTSESFTVRRLFFPLTLINSILLFGLATFTIVASVSYSFILHYWVNIICLWFTVLHFYKLSNNSST